jgi:hypothetical protein
MRFDPMLGQSAEVVEVDAAALAASTAVRLAGLESPRPVGASCAARFEFEALELSGAEGTLRATCAAEQEGRRTVRKVTGP